MAFRVAAFESIVALGEFDLTESGPKAFDKLDLDLMTRIFAPLVASMGNDGTMFSWMKATDFVMKKEEEVSHCAISSVNIFPLCSIFSC